MLVKAYGKGNRFVPSVMLLQVKKKHTILSSAIKTCSSRVGAFIGPNLNVLGWRALIQLTDESISGEAEFGASRKCHPRFKRSNPKDISLA